MVDWALSFWADLATALRPEPGPEYRSSMQVQNAGRSSRSRALRLRLRLI
jgi:hypothetical protein